MSKNINREIMVSIQCMAFNHEPYIRQCLDGFVMQKTNFYFEAIIHDDASTDGTSDIIREYERMYPDIIKPIYQIENQYSKHDGSIRRALDSKTRGKYIALCEGDDYWIDPLKLQKQVDFLEANPWCTMTCNRTMLYSVHQNKIVGENYCYNRDQIVDSKDVIQRGGLFISTCSILFRPSIIENYPDYCKKCHVGDYPLQIMATMKGHIYYINKPMSVYRVENSSSWMGKQEWCTPSPKRIKTVQSIISMFEGFSKDYPEFSHYFKQEIAQYINSSIPNWRFSMKDVDFYLSNFQPQIDKYSFWWKVDMMIMKVRIPYVRGIYSLIFKKQFEALNTKR